MIGLRLSKPRLGSPPSPSFLSPNLGAGNRRRSPLRRVSRSTSKSLLSRTLRHSNNASTFSLLLNSSSSSSSYHHNSYHSNNSSSSSHSRLGQHSHRASTMQCHLLTVSARWDPSARHTLLCLRAWKTSLQRSWPIMSYSCLPGRKCGHPS